LYTHPAHFQKHISQTVGVRCASTRSSLPSGGVEERVLYMARLEVLTANPPIPKPEILIKSLRLLIKWLLKKLKLEN
jgi:hypothetical protein